MDRLGRAGEIAKRRLADLEGGELHRERERPEDKKNPRPGEGNPEREREGGRCPFPRRIVI